MAMSVMLTAGLLAGCATGGGANPEDQIHAALNHFKAGMESGDIEQIGMALAADFEHYEYGSKDDLLGFLQSAIDSGDLGGAEINLENAEIQLEGDTATVYPVELIANFGGATLEFTMKKQEDGSWKASTMEVEGV